MSTLTRIAPSKIARTVAAKEWPEVQSQNKACAGVYRFTCAGHGGLVAVLPQAEKVLDECALNALRQTGRIVEVGVWTHGRRNQFFYSPEYTEASWTEYKECNPLLQVVEVGVFEEDSEYAILHYVSQAVRDGDGWGNERRAEYEAAGYHTPKRARQSLETWNPAFLDAYEGRPDYRATYEEKLAAETFPFRTESANGMNRDERAALRAFCEQAAISSEVAPEWRQLYVRDLDNRCYRAGEKARVQDALDTGMTLAEAAAAIGWSNDYCEHLLSDNWIR